MLKGKISYIYFVSWKKISEGEYMKISKIAILFFLMTIVLCAQKKLNLNECVEIALSKNYSIQKASSAIENAENKRLLGYGTLMPSIFAGAGFDWNRSEFPAEIRYFNGFPINIPGGSSESRSFSSYIGSRLILFDGLANYNTIAKNSKEVQSARYSVEKAKQDIIFQTANFYFNLLKYKKLLEAKEEELKWNKKNFEYINAKKELGSATQTDYLTQQARMLAAENDYWKAKSDYETAKAEFVNFLGLDVFDEYDFEDVEIENLPSLKADSYNLNDLYAQSLAKRFDYKKSLVDIEIAKRNLSLARSNYYPTLSTSFYARTSAKNIDKLGDARSYTFAIDLQIPIFNNFNVDYNVELSKINLKMAEIDKLEIENRIKIEIKKAALEYENAIKRLEASEKSYQAAFENLRREEEKYKLGGASILNLLLVNNEYAIASQNRITAKYDYLRSKFQLDYYLGNLEIENKN